MSKQKNLEKLIFETFDNSIKGTNIYYNNGSMWIIFTEDRSWIVEFTKDKTLWYNYKHFIDILVLFGMDLDEGAEYIKKWYEDKFIFNVGKNSERYINESLVDNIINKGVKDTIDGLYRNNPSVDDTIQNGVKHTEKSLQIDGSCVIEDTIQNGVKRTSPETYEAMTEVEDTIQNGVKRTLPESIPDSFGINDAIQNGVKDTISTLRRTILGVDDIIKNGVKHIEDGDWLDGDERIENIIKDGVKS